jgi:iron complex transport system substrate-binding protein
MRIVSLLPSATEIVCQLGLRRQLVGVTHECDFPPGVSELPHVTQTNLPATATGGEIDRLVREQLSTERSLYQLERDRLAALQPDLIITQTLCEVCAVAESDVQAAMCRLPRTVRILNLEPQSLGEVLESLEDVANAVGVPERGAEGRRRLQARIDAVTRSLANAGTRPRAVVLEWIDPPFSAGHWVPEIVNLAGGREMIGKPGERSITLTWPEVIEAIPEFLFVSCCGFNIERTKEELPIMFERLARHELPCLKNGNVFVLDGSAYLSRPGPRLVDVLELMAWTMHPERLMRPEDVSGIERIA